MRDLVNNSVKHRPNVDGSLAQLRQNPPSMCHAEDAPSGSRYCQACPCAQSSYAQPTLEWGEPRPYSALPSAMESRLRLESIELRYQRKQNTLGSKQSRRNVGRDMPRGR